MGRPVPLPEATKNPCVECPWRVDSAPGHLGPHTAEEWRQAAHGEGAIACHMTLDGDEGWESDGVRQCAGAAQFRTNVFKLPRHPEVAVAAERDSRTIFGCDGEFLAHHRKEK